MYNFKQWNGIKENYLLAKFTSVNLVFDVWSELIVLLAYPPPT